MTPVDACRTLTTARIGRRGTVAGWKLQNQNGRFSLSGKEGEREGSAFSASLMV
jgi:hypothetical protein